MGKADKDAEAKHAILKYLKAQNRPYSTNDIVANLRNEFGKTVVQKALDSLVEETFVVEKVNGKQKAYVVNQIELPAASEAEVAKIESDTKAATQEMTTLAAEVKCKEDKIRFYSSQVSTAEATIKLEQVREEIKVMETKLGQLTQNKTEAVTADAMNEAKADQSQVVKEWRKRKRMFDSVADAVLESYMASKKAFMEEIGAESDQDAGAVMPKV